ncbi:glutamate-cysteine ligase family protein [Streptococcus oricebi]|uniref:glutamate--cysteine ligase n=1 Tax=Streptococcus oricebi TaxID=1547447 RepID=A0ABS5B5Z9_9STRE|nr:glutamate-cysteine ligase family protein [Streptococcus oricebi]MBP2624262.1 gamma-glutamylcysteine synthetase [Streptococcus oricebi]
MSRSLQLLKERYLENLKPQPDLYVGIELEFPIVNLAGQATDLSLAKSLLERLAPLLKMQVEQEDLDGNPIQLYCPQSQDRILFEVSYNTLEFAFGRARRIQEVEERFNNYLKEIQAILQPANHALQGYGVHPYWDKNDNQPVKAPRYQMLMQYLKLADNEQELHTYPEYGAFICGSQVQLDVSRSNYLEVINAFNQIEAAKAYLFANSEFWGQNWPTKISRDLFWEESMHGIYPENVGVNAADFKDENSFFDYLNHSAIFTAEREGKTYYFRPIQAKDYLQQEAILAYDIDGKQAQIKPVEKDFQQHRSYQYQDLTTRGTVEFRSVCTQPLKSSFAPAAFHLGLLVNLDKFKSYLKQAPFFEQYGRNYKQLRRYFSQKELDFQARIAIANFSKELLSLAEEGLQARGKGEEVYLTSLKEW